MPIEAIKKMSQQTFRNKVKVAVTKAAYLYLSNEKQRRNKVTNVKHEELKMQKYLCPNGLDIQQVKLLFLLRARMVDVRVNFNNKYQDTLCPVCKEIDKPDTEQHVLQCSVLLQNTNLVMDKNLKFSQIFDSDVEIQISVTRMFEHFWSIRKKILSKSENK